MQTVKFASLPVGALFVPPSGSNPVYGGAIFKKLNDNTFTEGKSVRDLLTKAFDDACTAAGVTLEDLVSGKKNAPHVTLPESYTALCNVEYARLPKGAERVGLAVGDPASIPNDADVVPLDHLPVESPRATNEKLFGDVAVGSTFRLKKPTIDDIILQGLDAARIEEMDAHGLFDCEYVKRNDLDIPNPIEMIMQQMVDTDINPPQLSFYGETRANAEIADTGRGVMQLLDEPVLVVTEGNGMDRTFELPTKTVPFEKVPVGRKFALLDSAPARVYEKLNGQRASDGEAPEDFFEEGDGYKLTAKGKRAANAQQISGPLISVPLPNNAKIDEESIRLACIQADRVCVVIEEV